MSDDLAPWRPTRHKIGKPHVTEYLKHYPMSEPVKDFDDRNALYCMYVFMYVAMLLQARLSFRRRFNLCSSALYPGNLRFRNMYGEFHQLGPRDFR
jgi:protein-ribulosamine 3-kinase